MPSRYEIFIWMFCYGLPNLLHISILPIFYVIHSIVTFCCEPFQSQQKNEGKLDDYREIVRITQNISFNSGSII